MSIEDEARQEADKRFPELILAPENDLRADDFIEGAKWASEQADHVERIARNLAQASTFTGQDALLLVKTAQKIAEVEQADREPSDAEVLEASLTFERVWDEIIDSFDPERDDGITYIQAAMRAALIAAQEARNHE